VPVRHVVLPELPTQEHDVLLFGVASGEIDQSAVQILDLDAKRFELGESGGHIRCGLFGICVQVSHAFGIEATPVSRYSPTHALEALAHVNEAPVGADEPLDERPDDRQRLVRFLLGEEPHAGMLNSAFALRMSAPILALAASALLGAGCGERAEPLGILSQTYPVSVQGAGDRPTVVKTRPERIVALDPGSAELVIALGAGGRLVGIPSGLGVSTPAKAREVVRPTGLLDVEAVVALKPDLIVATPSTDELDLARAGRESGAAVYVQPAASIQNVEEGAIDLGFLVGNAPRARQIVGQIERRIAVVEQRLAAVRPVSVFVDTGFFITVPRRSLLGDLVAKAKGESVAGPTPGPGPFPLTQLARLNPAVYLATSDSEVTLEQLRQNAETEKLKAVRKKRLAIISVALTTRAGPRIAEGFEAVARALHPDAFG
jgi:cobalamin transport system substrate-binding protein